MAALMFGGGFCSRMERATVLARWGVMFFPFHHVGMSGCSRMSWARVWRPMVVLWLPWRGIWVLGSVRAQSRNSWGVAMLF